MYEYKAHVLSVYDGDTVRVTIDLGMGILMKNQPIRLYGINAPEMRGKEKSKGVKSRDYLRELIFDKEVVLQTIKDKSGKYGRLLGKIYIDGVCVNDVMVQDGFAEYKDY